MMISQDSNSNDGDSNDGDAGSDNQRKGSTPPSEPADAGEVLGGTEMMR